MIIHVINERIIINHITCSNQYVSSRLSYLFNIMMSESNNTVNPTIKIKAPRKSRAKVSKDDGFQGNAKEIQEILEKQIHEQMKQTVEKTMKGGDSQGEVLDHLGEYIEEPFTILESYFHGQHLDRLVRHQIESYNHFINYQMQKTIQMFNPVVIRSENDYVEEHDKYLLEVSVSFLNFKLYPPQIYENNGATKTMFPQEAKLRNFTYASTMTVDIKIDYTIRNTESMDNPRILSKIIPKVNIGKMPIMIKSSICVLSQNRAIDPVYMGECPMDCGGYFIIKGSEKTVLGQERAAENRVYCFDGKNTTKWSWFAEIKSIPDFKCISPKQIEMMIASKNNGFGHGIFMNIPRIKQPIELFVVFRALGVMSDKAICEYILLQIPGESSYQTQILNFLQASIIDANKYMTQEDALRHITAAVAYTPINMDKEKGLRKKQEFTHDVLNNDLFPHCKTLPQKLYMLGYMCQKLIKTSMGYMPPDDRDSYVNKRIELTGTLLNNLFRNYFNKLVKEMQKQVVREINNGSWRSMDNYENIINMTNIYKIMKSTTIENGINRALSTGDFSIKQSNSSKVGVAQVLNRLTYLSSLSHSRRINTPLEKSGELIAPRKLHNTTWGFLCLTGDTEVLMANRIDTKKIKDIRDGDWVNTVNRTNLLDEPSPMHSWFCKMPDKLYEITTISGRKIKATAEHPFLVNVGDGKYEMIKLEDLNAGDKMIVRHMVETIPDENRTPVVIHDTDVMDHYRMELSEMNMLNNPIPIYKLKIIARLIGALNTDGHIGTKMDTRGKQDKLYYYATFNVGEEYDVYQLADDIKTLGFDRPSIRRSISNFEDKVSGRVSVMKTWQVSKAGAFAYLLSLLGGFVGKKTNMKRIVPEWLIHAEPSIKREFLSAFQGGDGCRLSYQQNVTTWKLHLGETSQTTHNDYLMDTTEYMTQIVNMFSEFDIQCHLRTNPVKDEPKTRVCLAFSSTVENLSRYADVINYTYCEEKRRASGSVIEHMKIRMVNKTKRDIQYKYILDNYQTESMERMIETTGISERQIYKVISKNKNGICPSPRSTTDIMYDVFINENTVNNGCISVPILSINEIEPELVYDFTTASENHSFVSQGVVTSNCSVESPEGQSIGVVKNIAYMAHITIPTNSSSLYDYILPHILKLEDVQHTSEVFGKVRVFINGAWVGVTDTPAELYQEIKNKKYKGIINIYTSVIFDYKNMEIRVCNDGGRLTRPVLKVANDRAVITEDVIHKLSTHELSWNDLLVSCRIPESAIEYIDPEEQNFAMIAMKTNHGYVLSQERNGSGSDPSQPRLHFRYTHCEIHPSTIFGVLGSCIPFPEHNQSPRNTYQCLDHMETVQMSDGKRKCIKDVEVGDRVMTFDPDTLVVSETTVVGQFVQEPIKPVYKLTLMGGRSIVATEDHRFMTDQGWKTIQEIMDDNVQHIQQIRVGVHMRPYTVAEFTEVVSTEDEQYNHMFMQRLMRFMKLYRKETTGYQAPVDATEIWEMVQTRGLFKIIEFFRYLMREPSDSDSDYHVTTDMDMYHYRFWRETTVLETDGFLFLPVENLELVVPSVPSPVSCIEVESTNHSFITGSRFGSANCCMGKQAIGVYALNYDQRMDKTSYVLSYPSRPLVDTRVMNFIQLNRIPSGHQITVAIMAFTAYNQEDSLLVSKGAIDRGLFMTTVYHTEKDEDKNIIRDEIIRCKPDPTKTKGIKYGNYDKLDAQGFIPENTLVENRDVIIAKTVPIKENRNDPTKTVKYEDQSKTYRTTEECYVDKNYTGRNGDGYNFAKVRVRALRKPVLGDKFSSRAGQKGTCGLIIPECDMPFTKDGLRPDIILNPHAIPSRMTIAQLKETILGKVLLELGMFGDGTSFGDLDVKTICNELQRIGYESYGNEVMYNGFTGEQIETSIFIGPVYYQRLKHMVNDKQHSRSIGPMVNLTRQPAEGRSRDGGFRIGEMERDVMIAHGMSKFCRERLYDVSDKYSTHVCGKCGMIACYNDESMKQTKFAKSDMSIHLCRTCGNMTDFAKVEIPYAYKLLAQELQTINIVPRIITE